MTMEEGLGMNKDRKRVDIREEYFVSLPSQIEGPREECQEIRDLPIRWELSSSRRQFP